LGGSDRKWYLFWGLIALTVSGSQAFFVLIGKNRYLAGELDDKQKNTKAKEAIGKLLEQLAQCEREAYDGSDGSDFDRLRQQIEQIKLRVRQIAPKYLDTSFESRFLASRSPAGWPQKSAVHIHGARFFAMTAILLTVRSLYLDSKSPGARPAMTEQCLCGWFLRCVLRIRFDLNVYLCALFESNVLAFLILQRVFDSNLPIKFLSSFNGDLRCFLLAWIWRLDDFFHCSWQRRTRLLFRFS
jgi:hypothetical protein